MRLLIVEDSERLRESLTIGLRTEGYAVDAAADGTQGLWMAQGNPYDVVVLDLMLPGLDGLTVLQRLRDANVASRVLVLTAKDQLADKVKGLRTGADDYLVKPFAFDELLARVEALVRRRHGQASPVISAAGGLKIDTAARTVSRGDQRIDLAAREYALLEYLARQPGRIVARSEIESHLYDDRADPMSNVVDAAVYALRRKLDPPGGPSAIRTHRGLGYELVQD